MKNLLASLCIAFCFSICSTVSAQNAASQVQKVDKPSSTAHKKNQSEMMQQKPQEIQAPRTAPAAKNDKSEEFKADEKKAPKAPVPDYIKARQEMIQKSQQQATQSAESSSTNQASSTQEKPSAIELRRQAIEASKKELEAGKASLSEADYNASKAKIEKAERALMKMQEEPQK